MRPKPIKVAGRVGGWNLNRTAGTPKSRSGGPVEVVDDDQIKALIDNNGSIQQYDI